MPDFRGLGAPICAGVFCMGWRRVASAFATGGAVPMHAATNRAGDGAVTSSIFRATIGARSGGDVAGCTGWPRRHGGAAGGGWVVHTSTSPARPSAGTVRAPPQHCAVTLPARLASVPSTAKNHRPDEPGFGSVGQGAQQPCGTPHPPFLSGGRGAETTHTPPKYHTQETSPFHGRKNF